VEEVLRKMAKKISEFFMLLKTVFESSKFKGFLLHLVDINILPSGKFEMMFGTG
jgi:hypothetical protein